MNQSSDSFNLLDEPWIPVLLSNGTSTRMGVLETLAEAHRIREIATSNPMDRVAILRFLLAILYWCRGNPTETADAEQDAPCPSDWFDKLHKSRALFNLFGEGPRFYQYRRTNEEPDSAANYLIHEVPTGTNKVHFRRCTDKHDGLCRACCAMGLLRLPVFTTSGGSGKSPGINSKPPVYALEVGPRLRATLGRLWQPVAPTQLGQPSWTKPDQPLPDGGQVPLLLGLTWLPRRVWLADPSDPPARCAACAEHGRLVRACVFKGLGSTKQEGSATRVWRDPHVLRVPDDKGVQVPFHARDPIGTSDAAAGQWSLRYSGLLADEARGGAETRVWCVSFATVQNDKYLEATEQLMESRSVISNATATECAPRKWGAGARTIERNLARASEHAASKRPPRAMSLATSIRPHIEHRVSQRASELLTWGEGAWSDAAEEYGPMMEVVARSVAPAATVADTRRRRTVSRIRPELAGAGPASADETEDEEGSDE